MALVFVDTGYLEALVDRKDQHRDAAIWLARNYVPRHQLITSEMVLTEFLASVSKRAREVKFAAVGIVDDLNRAVTVVRQSHERFERAFGFYRQRLDHRYSLVDCSSFEIMRRRGISEALRYDRNFEEEGFSALLRRSR